MPPTRACPSANAPAADARPHRSPESARQTPATTHVRAPSDATTPSYRIPTPHARAQPRSSTHGADDGRGRTDGPACAPPARHRHGAAHEANAARACGSRPPTRRHSRRRRHWCSRRRESGAARGRGEPDLTGREAPPRVQYWVSTAGSAQRANGVCADPACRCPRPRQAVPDATPVRPDGPRVASLQRHPDWQRRAPRPPHATPHGARRWTSRRRHENVLREPAVRACRRRRSPRPAGADDREVWTVFSFFGL